MDDALNYRLIQYALSLVQPLCRKIKILARYRLEELLHRVLAAGLPKAVVDAVSLSDQDSFFADFLFGNAVTSFTKTASILAQK